MNHEEGNRDSSDATRTTSQISAWEVAATGPETGGGVIKQVVQARKTNVQGFSGGGDQPIAGLEATLTPQSASSKILVVAHVSGFAHNAAGGGLCIMRDSTKIGLADHEGSRRRSSFAGDLYTGDGSGSNHGLFAAHAEYLDSPNSGGALTYKVVTQNPNFKVRINSVEAFASTDDESVVLGVSSLTLFEVGSLGSSPGVVLQLLQSYMTNRESVDSGNTGDHDIPGLAVDITPSAETSKVLVTSYVSGFSHDAQGAGLCLQRKIGASGAWQKIGLADVTGNRHRTSFSGSLYSMDGAGSAQMHFAAATSFLDSPSTGDEVSYKVTIQKGNSGSVVRINYEENNSDSTDTSYGVSHITVMEIRGE